MPRNSWRPLGAIFCENGTPADIEATQGPFSHNEGVKPPTLYLWDYPPSISARNVHAWSGSVGARGRQL